MDSNALYYTFSAVPQTLAGAFGLLLAVALYQLQSLEEVLRSQIEEMNELVMKDKSKGVDPLAAHGRWREFARTTVMAAYGSGERNDIVGIHVRAIFDNFKKIADRHGSIKDHIGVSLKATGATIAISLVLLALTPVVVCYVWFSWLCLIVVVILALLCLGLYFPLVRSVAT